MDKFIGPKNWTIEEIQERAGFVGKTFNERLGRPEMLVDALVLITLGDVDYATRQGLISEEKSREYSRLYTNDNNTILVIPPKLQSR